MRTPSLVWRFFDRIERDGRVVAISCQLCDKEYKYFGNTTNLRVHIVKNHPIQWELAQNGTVPEHIRPATTDDESNQSTTKQHKKLRKSYKNDNVRFSISVNKDSIGEEGGLPQIKVNVLESESEAEENNDAESMINNMHRAADEEWLNEEVFNNIEYVHAHQPPKRKRLSYRTIKQEPSSPSAHKEKPKTIIVKDTKDENQSFGEFVSNKLRNMKNNQTRSNVQQLISTILWQAEFGVYDDIATVKDLLLSSMQRVGDDQTKINEETTVTAFVVNATEEASKN